jgi:ribosomal protein L12E/L44/L45/RPP1/RPP2
MADELVAAAVLDDVEAQKVLGRATYGSYRAIIKAVTNVSEKIIVKALKDTLANDLAKDRIKELIPYLYAATFLSFAGREINEETICSVMEPVCKPNDERLRIVSQLGLRNHLIYVYSYYYLLANGRDASESAVRDVVKAVGVRFDKKAFDETLEYIDAY